MKQLEIQQPITFYGHTALSQGMSPPLHLPNKQGEPVKTELVLERSAERTVKLNWWHLPDVDRHPHNHPWEVVECHILQGGYTEERYWLDNGVLKSSTHTYRAGDINRFTHNVFHLVRTIEPGTLSKMACGPEVANNEWGYLDLKTKKYVRAKEDPGFMKRLEENNKFLKRK